MGLKWCKENIKEAARQKLLPRPTSAEVSLVLTFSWRIDSFNPLTLLRSHLCSIFDRDTMTVTSPDTLEFQPVRSLMVTAESRQNVSISRNLNKRGDKNKGCSKTICILKGTTWVVMKRLIVQNSCSADLVPCVAFLGVGGEEYRPQQRSPSIQPELEKYSLLIKLSYSSHFNIYTK